jgi:hypothetical protein
MDGVRVEPAAMVAIIASIIEKVRRRGLEELAIVCDIPDP